MANKDRSNNNNLLINGLIEEMASRSQDSRIRLDQVDFTQLAQKITQIKGMTELKPVFDSIPSIINLPVDQLKDILDTLTKANKDPACNMTRALIEAAIKYIGLSEKTKKAATPVIKGISKSNVTSMKFANLAISDAPVYRPNTVMSPPALSRSRQSSDGSEHKSRKTSQSNTPQSPQQWSAGLDDDEEGVV